MFHGLGKYCFEFNFPLNRDLMLCHIWNNKVGVAFSSKDPNSDKARKKSEVVSIEFSIFNFNNVFFG